jgi:hypothetical protein
MIQRPEDVSVKHVCTHRRLSSEQLYQYIRRHCLLEPDAGLSCKTLYTYYQSSSIFINLLHLIPIILPCPSSTRPTNHPPSFNPSTHSTDTPIITWVISRITTSAIFHTSRHLCLHSSHPTSHPPSCLPSSHPTNHAPSFHPTYYQPHNN